MRIGIGKQTDVHIQQDMIGLFFEDINYAADGGLYAEMIENRSFEFLKAGGTNNDYYTEYAGGYGWSVYPVGAEANLRFVSGSPLSEENPHYMRVNATEANVGFANQAYEGIHLDKGMTYNVTFFARSVRFEGAFTVLVEKDGVRYAAATIAAAEGTNETFNHFKKYELVVTAEETVTGATFAICLSEAGIVEFDFVSMFPGDAVAGLFRKDLFEYLKALKPGFIRFPGGCIIEGNTLANRYRFKDTLKAPWDRKNNWNRWAVHQNNADNNFESKYAHYNQTLGLGYYEYFLLCELIGAKPIPVLNVGLACQYQTDEMVAVGSAAFEEFLQDAVDLIEFANGDVTTKWGAVRAQMGHEASFDLDLLGIGNEQWETDKANFFERYVRFEAVVHEHAPNMRLIGSAGPDITSEKYEKAWAFYNENKGQADFVYAVDEHYYVKPEWLYEHVDFYDEYSRDVKVFSGEYAAHPFSGMNRPDANNLGGALAEAAFLTGVERNADVVVLASYAPLFARIGYAQWSPDMIWFDSESSYATPSYHVQKMYGNNMGTVTLDTAGMEKEAAKDKIYYSLSYDEQTEDIIVKVVNANLEAREITLDVAENWSGRTTYQAELLQGEKEEDYNQITEPTQIGVETLSGNVMDGMILPPLSFAVIRIGK